MREFTNTEIDLCKKIANKERKKIERGDWVFDDREDEFGLVEFKEEDLLTISLYPETIKHIFQKNQHLVPLWQEHDCLEWLREKKWRNYQISFNAFGGGELHIVRVPFEFRAEDEIIVRGKSFLEALLRAVLAVMEE